jgi:hypothetical protein
MPVFRVVYGGIGCLPACVIGWLVLHNVKVYILEHDSRFQSGPGEPHLLSLCQSCRPEPGIPEELGALLQPSHPILWRLWFCHRQDRTHSGLGVDSIRLQLNRRDLETVLLNLGQEHYSKFSKDDAAEFEPLFVPRSRGFDNGVISVSGGGGLASMHFVCLTGTECIAGRFVHEDG